MLYGENVEKQKKTGKASVYRECSIGRSRDVVRRKGAKVSSSLQAVLYQENRWESSKLIMKMK